MATTLEEAISVPAATSSIDIANDIENKDLQQSPSEDFTHFPDPEIYEPTWREVVAWWAEFTSIHGAYYALERGHFKPWKQIIWCIITATCFVGLLVTIAALVQEFGQYTLNTSVKNVNPDALEFPEVTVCNTNMYDVSRQNSTGIYVPTNEEELFSISQPFTDFILYTSFDRGTGPYEYVNLTRVWKPTVTSFGLCYTYITEKQVFKPGTQAGLEFWAWLGQENYTWDTVEAGLRVIVTQPGTTLVSDQSMQTLVPAGVSAFVGLSRNDYKNERKQPWTQCKGTAPSYTSEKCRAECIYAATREKCGCRLFGDPIRDQNHSYCYWPCDIEGTIELDDCDCETPCEEQHFNIAYSGASIAQSFARQVEFGSNFTLGEFDANFVRVVVNFQAIRYAEYTQSKATSINSLISDLGGQLGFFMGFSIISVVELFGELIGLRLLPRLWGRKELYGIGQLQRKPKQN